MAESKFVYNARFVGRKYVDGPLNDFRLSEVVEELKTSDESVKKKVGQADEVRCNVEFSDRNLLITFIKKDEGFESDTESAKSVESPGQNVAAESDKSNVSAVEEKIIKDHVFRFNEPGGEDSYSSNSSGSSDSETSDHNKSSVSATSSTSSSPTVELSKYKFDYLDTYNVSDVLICHTDKMHKNCIIWVIRKGGSLEALVFEFTTEENAKQLFKRFHEVSKRSKLERHRRRKSDGGSILTRGTELLQVAGGQGSNQIKIDQPKGKTNATINNIDTSIIERVVEKTSITGGLQKWNLVQHTDKNGVTHIEVEANLDQKGDQSNHLVSTPPILRQTNGIGEKGLLSSGAQPRSLISFSPNNQGKYSPASSSGIGMKGERGKFAKELESILSSEMKRRDDSHTVNTVSQVISELSEHHSDNGSTGFKGQTRQRPPGESLSLRQRAPAMLLRKLDEFEEKAHKIWAKAEAEEENKKVWNKSSNSVIGISNPPKGPQLDTPSPHKEKITGKATKDKREEKINQNVIDKDKFTNSAIKCKQKEQKSDGDHSRVLVPTKTGKEPHKKLYPKESPPAPFFPHGGRYVSLGVGMPGGQPQSLPIYPGLQVSNLQQIQQLQAAGLPWARYPQEMTQLDLSQSVWKYTPQSSVVNDWRHSIQGAEGLQPGRSRSRDRSRGIGENDRRRAQSKSPARRPHQDRGSRYMEAVNLAPDMSGISKMFRDFGGAMKAKMGKKLEQKAPSCSMSDLPDVAHLKSNLKKNSGAKNSPNPANARLGGASSNTVVNGSDNRKVHFNKFATVQMMG